MSENLRDVVAAHFKAHPGEWVSMQTLAKIAGTGGWRSRVSQCHTELGMVFEKRQYNKRLPDGTVIRCSDRMYRPKSEPVQASLLGRQGAAA